jgi:hypothetical protein
MTKGAKLGSFRVTKRTWYAAGGLANPLCWRRQRRGAWQYFIRLD